MSMTFSNPDRVLFSAKRQLPDRSVSRNREKIRWPQVIRLPAFLLLSMALAGLVVAGNTRYLEMDSERLIADADQIAIDTYGE